MIDPINQSALYNPVNACRWRGCVDSVISNGAAVCETPTPIPARTRALKKTQWFEVAIWTIDAMITSDDPMRTQIFRPRLSAM